MSPVKIRVRLHEYLNVRWVHMCEGRFSEVEARMIQYADIEGPDQTVYL